jgi:hypothetical protein
MGVLTKVCKFHFACALMETTCLQINQYNCCLSIDIEKGRTDYGWGVRSEHFEYCVISFVLTFSSSFRSIHCNMHVEF